jgi:ABC-type uncharacterized transport system permease subunit
MSRAGLAREAVTIAIALLVAMAAGSLLVLLFGQSPARVYGALLESTWGSAYGIGQVIAKATPLVFTGLSVALAFRAGLFNIGAEGQMVLGALATALAGAALPPSTPPVIAVPLAVLAGALAGAAWGAIPGALKAWTGAHEVINTIMMNFVASAFVLWAGNRFFFESETTHTARVIPNATLPGLGLGASAANAGALLAVAAAGVVWFALARTRRGYELRAFGLSPAAAENAGIAPGRMTIAAMTAAGALAGLVGSSSVLGYKHYFEEGLGRGAGFMGIAAALLGRGHPAGVVAAALLLATLAHGGLAVNAMVPKELIDVLLAVIILAIAATAATLARRSARP